MDHIANLCRLTNLLDDNQIHTDIEDMVIMIDTIINAHIPENYPTWRGVSGPKLLRLDIPQPGHPELVSQLCLHHKENFVLAPAAIQKEGAK